MSNYPISLDDGVSLPDPTALGSTVGHANLHTNIDAVVIALENKLGISSSTPTNGFFLVGTGVGSSAWTKATPTGGVVGTSDTQTLTNKSIDGGSNTFTNIPTSSLALGAITTNGYTQNTGTFSPPAASIAATKLSTDSSWSWVDISGTATLVGWSSYTTKQIFYRQIGKNIVMAYVIVGTSNSISTTISLPVVPSIHLNYYENALSLAIDNSTISVSSPRQSIDNVTVTPATTLTLYSTAAGGAWTASGTKHVRGQITYEAA